MKTHLSILFVALLVTTSLQAENWPAWRGADGRAVSNDRNLPLKWNASENVVNFIRVNPAPG